MAATTPRVFGWLADYQGCGYYRVALPLLALKHQLGWAVNASVRLTAPMLPDYDVIVGQRVCLPGATVGWVKLRKAGQHLLVYEVDDDLFNVDPLNRKAHELFSRPAIQANIRRCMSAAHLVTVSTEPLAELARQYNDNVVVLPNCIHERLLTWPSPVLREPDGRTIIGWAGSPTHATDFQLLRATLGRLAKRNPNLVIRFAGTAHPEGLPPAQVEVTGWQPMNGEYYRVLEYDVGVAPLVDSVFNRSKSHIKTLEYAALGIPVVASAAGPYRGFVQHDHTGYLVHREHEWSRYLYRLVRDRDRRVRFGAAARQQAAGWTIQRNMHRWAQIYQTKPWAEGARGELVGLPVGLPAADRGGGGGDTDARDLAVAGRDDLGREVAER